MTESAANPDITPEPVLDRFYRWEEPDASVTVHLKPEMVDHLQASVLFGVDSARSAGNEVGGVLLGRRSLENGRTRIVVEEFEAVPREGQNHPHYAVTSRDAARFQAVLARGRQGTGRSVVGYYRSHNRAGLFLSADDLTLIRRFFPEPDQVFLILKTLPNRACTAGFFFWKDGEIQSEFTNSEVPLIPIAACAVGEDPPLAQAVNGNGPVPPTPGTERSGRRLWIAALLVATGATTLVVGLARHHPPRPHLDGGSGRAPAATAKGMPPASGAKPEPASVSNKSVTTTSQTSPIPTSSRKGRAPVGSLEFPPTADAVPPTRRQLSIPSVSKAQPAPPDLPLDASPSETAAAPPVPALQLSLPASPIAPPIEAPRTNPEPVTSLPPVPVEAHPLIGPQVIHEATPAVPRGVGLRITTDAQVNVEVNIDDKGRVTSARVVSTKGAAAALLTIEALKAAQLFRFRPAQQNGHNVSSVMVLTFHFEPTAQMKEE
jgi:protein TonB